MQSQNFIKWRKKYYRQSGWKLYTKRGVGIVENIFEKRKETIYRATLKIMHSHFCGINTWMKYETVKLV